MTYHSLAFYFQFCHKKEKNKKGDERRKKKERCKDRGGIRKLAIDKVLMYVYIQ
jgi:hypothetical protein